MAEERPHPRQIRKRILAKEPVIGTFMKVPSSHNTELLGNLGYDFVMLDEEHAPWTRQTLDMAILGARAFGTAPFVRIGRPDANSILSILDDGALGFMCPHVDTAEKAQNLVSWANYKDGTRGAGVGRGGDYGKRGDAHRQIADDEKVVIAMIEDASAVDRIDEIASVPGIDAFFIGRGDLALSLSNAKGNKPTVKEATEKVAKSVLDHGKILATLTQDINSDEGKWMIDLGTTILLVAADATFLTRAAGKSLKEFEEAKSRFKR